MATKSLPASEVFVTKSVNASDLIFSAYKYRIAIVSEVENEDETKVVHLMTNSITLAHLLSRHYSGRKYENNERVIEFSASIENDNEMNNNGKSEEIKEEKTSDENETENKKSPKQRASAKPALAEVAEEK